MLNRLLFPAALAVLFAFSSAHAQEPSTQPAASTATSNGQTQGASTTAAASTLPVASGGDTTADTARQQIADLSKKLDVIAKEVDDRDADDDKLVDLKLRTEGLSKVVTGATASLTPRLTQIGERLTALGNAPTDGSAEDPAVKSERDKLTAEKAALTAVTSEADNVSSRAAKLSNHITDVRRELFASTLFKKTEISPAVFSEAGEAFVETAADFRDSVGSWLTFAWGYKHLQLMAAIFLSTLVALVMVSTGRRAFSPLVQRQREVEEPSYLSRLSVAFWSILLPSLSLAVFSAVSFFLMDNFNVLRGDIAPMLAVFLEVLTAVFFVIGLTHAILQPGAPHWRLVNVSNGGARLLMVLLTALAILNGLDFLAGGLSEALSAAVVLTVVKSFIFSIIAGLIFLCLAFVRPMRPDDTQEGAFGRPWPRIIRIILMAVGIGLILASLLGYVGLARFAATQIIMTGAIAATMYIGLLSGKAILTRGAFADTMIGEHMGHRFNIGELELDQAGLAAGLGVYAIVFVIGVPLMLLQWGFHMQEIQLWIFQIFTEISIGKFHFSLLGILAGVVLFLFGLLATRWLQRWLDGNVLARSKLDSGVRNSVRTGFGYVGVAFAGLLGISAAGIDLSSLALVAGALSLGIGFGLQNIVSNFVSGLILLVERPFKVGDWVVTGTTEGFVRRISVRATEIETFQHLSIIVPNSELINASVGNWTHKNRLGRVEIPVSVSYSADPRRVMEILLEIAQGHAKVLKNPEPAVAFQGFGESALSFEIRLHLADVFDGMNVRNDIRLAIFERFREEGIDIPFPQRDLNFRVDKEMADFLRQAVSSRGPFSGNPDKVFDNMGGLHGHGVEDGDGPQDDADGDQNS